MYYNDDCKYWRCFEDRRGKAKQWWSFKELDNDQIALEIFTYLSLYKTHPKVIINDIKINTFHRPLKNIMDEIRSILANNEFKHAYISYPKFRVDLYKGKYDSYYDR